MSKVENNEYPFLDLNQLVWDDKKETVHTARIFKETYLEELREWQAEHPNTPRESLEEFSALAFNLGLSTEELHTKIQDAIDNPRGLSAQVKKYALEHNYPWDIAEQIIKQKPILFDKASRYYNSRKPAALYPPIEPKPPRVYEKRYKERMGKTKTQVIERFERWSAMDAVNNSDLDRHD